MTQQPPGDRRPIASRKLPVWQISAAGLAKLGISANGISVAGMIVAIIAGACLVATQFMDSLGARILFLTAAALIQLRLLANMLDGMVAILSGTVSPVGELFNEIPDRISDTVILVGAGYAAGGNSALGWAAACAALFVTYIRALGKSVGVPGLFQGPMSKSHRMFAMTLACLYAGLSPAAWQPAVVCMGAPVGLVGCVLALIVVGALVTAGRRLGRIVTALKKGGPTTKEKEL